MSEKKSRREALGLAARGVALVGLGGAAIHLFRRPAGESAWQLDPNKCVNSQLGVVGVEACDVCAVECVLPLSAVRAINESAICGRCYICPAYFDVKSAVDEEGLPSEKLCPRDAIERYPIGWVDPDDPANNYYEYVIDEERCNGCGLCVMACKEPAGLSSIQLEVRHDLCVDCNRCTISGVCPEDALDRILPEDFPLSVHGTRRES